MSSRMKTKLRKERRALMRHLNKELEGDQSMVAEVLRVGDRFDAGEIDDAQVQKELEKIGTRAAYQHMEKLTDPNATTSLLLRRRLKEDDGKTVLVELPE